MRSWFPRVALVAALALATAPAEATIRYVNAARPDDSGDGLSWAAAEKTLQAALAVAVSGDEVWVVAGTYEPDQGGGQTPGDRSATFSLISGVAIYGGFIGTEALRTERNPTANVTTLSCDLNGDDGPGPFEDNAENCNHVVLASGGTLDGFTISGGNADGPDIRGGGIYMGFALDSTISGCHFTNNNAEEGGAIYNEDSDSLITTCTFTGNNAAGAGGAIFNETNTSPTISGCTFDGNTATAQGGAIFNADGCGPIIRQSTFIANIGAGGGAVFNGGTAPALTLANCSFFGNSTTTFFGGAVSNRFAASATLVNCLFSGNSSAVSGGGIAADGSSQVTVINSTFSRNTAATFGGGVRNNGATVNLTNCIFSENSDGGGVNESAQIQTGSGTTSVNYSLVTGLTGGLGGTGNIGGDPLFVDFDGPNNTLGDEDDNLELLSGSPCIDAADNTGLPTDAADLDNDANTGEELPVDFENKARRADSPGAANTGNGSAPHVDIGAYELPAGGPNLPAAPPSPHDVAKNRYISFAPNNGGTAVAFKVTMTASTFTAPTGDQGWVGAPDGNGMSRIVAAPVTRVWPESVIHVGDCELAPSATYQIRATDDGGTSFTQPLTVTTVGEWGDVAPAFGAPDALDIVAVVDVFNAAPGALHLTRADLDPQYPNGVVNMADVFWVGKAFLGVGYPFTADCSTCTCESNANCDDTLFCNGKERCIDCQCQSGAVPCDSGCNEAFDTCAVYSTSVPILALVPVDAAGPHIVNGVDIAILPGGGWVKLEVKLSKWDDDLNGSPRLEVVQAALDSSSLLGANASPPQSGIDLTQSLVSCPSVDSTGDAACRSSFDETATAGIRCRPASELPGCGFTNCCQSSFQRNASADWVMTGASSLSGVRRATADIAWGAAFSGGGSGVLDPGSVRQVGTLLLNVPPTAGFGTYTVTLQSEVLESFLLDDSGDELPGKRLEATRISIVEAGACCDDGTGICNDFVAEPGCLGPGVRYGGDGSTCANISPPCLPPPTLLYVNAAATGLNNGTSWTNAFTDLQDALAAAVPNTEIWVAKGTYKPATCLPPCTGAAPQRAATFQLQSGVALYGGFFGGESDRDLRDPENNETILSGDLNGDDTRVACTANSPDCDSFGGLCAEGFCIISNNNAENSYHVVTGSGTDSTADLDGFAITAGNATASFPNECGAGLRNDVGSPTVRNCRFHQNSANCGGGIGNFSTSSPMVSNCTFTGNAVNGAGGAMYNNNSAPTVTMCRFSENRAEYGGGMYNFESSSPTVTNCVFSRNVSVGYGGGMGNYDTSNPIVTNCTFAGNSALTGGGAMWVQFSNPTLSNCTFSGNSTTGNGGGLECTNTGNPTLFNCILWGNSDSGGMDESAQIDTESSTPVVNYSIVQGSWTGAGGNNSSADPLFVDAGSGDVRLQSGSPAIDAADTTALPVDTYDLDDDGNTTEKISLDVAGNPRNLDDPTTLDTGVPGSSVVDMGAYEYISDCDGNGIPDGCDIDCGAPDGPCDFLGCGLGADCDGNDILDACDIAECDDLDPDYPGCDDCNLNGVRDDCDIASSTSLDVAIPIGVPDECTQPNTSGNWSDDIWNLTATDPYPDNLNPNAVPNLFVTIPSGFTLILDITVQINGLRILPGGTLIITDTPDGDLTITASPMQTAGIAPPPKLSKLTVDGHLYLANDRSVTVPTDTLAVNPGGILSELPGATAAPVESTAAVNAAEIVITGASCDGLVDGGEITLQDSMILTTTGRLIVDGRNSVCPPICSSVSQTAQEALGITPPPKLRARNSARVRVLYTASMLGTGAGLDAPDGTFTMLGAVVVVIDSIQPFELGGDFDNRSIVPSLYDWTIGKILLNGSTPQVFEVAGLNLGQTSDGFSTDEDTLSDTCPHSNYSMGSLEVAAPAEVIFVNRFANTKAVGCSEALYVHDLVFQSGATVTLDNCKVYYETLTDNGVIPTLLGCGELLSVEAPIPPPPPTGPRSGRSMELSLPPPSTSGPGIITALRIKLVELQNPVPPNVPQSPPPNFSTYEFASTCTDAGGCVRWVGQPEQFWESQDNPGLGSFRAARLQCTPFYHDWTTEGVFYVVGPEIAPSSTYDVQQVSPACLGLEENCTAVSTARRITTSRFGDAVAPFNPPSTTQQPDATDVTQLVNKFKNVTGGPIKPLAQMQPNVPELNGDLSASDIVQCVDAVKSFAYPFSGPCPCPSLAMCGQLECTGAATCTASALPGLGSAALCVKTCTGGSKHGKQCLNNNPVHNHCPGGVCGSVLECAGGGSAGQLCTADAQCPGSTCGVGFCRDRCGRCAP